MDEGYVSKVTIVAVAMWATVATMFAAAWGVALAWPEHWLYAVLLAGSASGLASFSAVMHNRIYVGRVTRLIRACSKLETVPGGELRAVREDSGHRSRGGSSSRYTDGRE